MIISAEERNRLMHAKNGNRGPNQYHPYIQVAIRQTRQMTPEDDMVWPNIPDTTQQPPSVHSLTQEAVTTVRNEGVTERVQQYVRWN